MFSVEWHIDTFKLRNDIGKLYDCKNKTYGGGQNTMTMTMTDLGTSKQFKVKKPTLNKKINDDIDSLENDNNFEQPRTTVKPCHTYSEGKIIVCSKISSDF